MSNRILYDEGLKNFLIKRMKDIFGDDYKRISHAIKVLSYALSIWEKEGGNGNVVVASAILHDIGIHEAEKKYGSNSGIYQEIEGPIIAEPILRDTDISDEDLQHVLKIIANHHSAKDIDTLEFRILWDADWMVNFNDLLPTLRGDENIVKEKIERIFKTATGRAIANREFVINNN